MYSRIPSSTSAIETLVFFGIPSVVLVLATGSLGALQELISKGTRKLDNRMNSRERIGEVL
jgi:hypothetical protein